MDYRSLSPEFINKMEKTLPSRSKTPHQWGSTEGTFCDHPITYVPSNFTSMRGVASSTGNGVPKGNGPPAGHYGTGMHTSQTHLALAEPYLFMEEERRSKSAMQMRPNSVASSGYSVDGKSSNPRERHFPDAVELKKFLLGTSIRYGSEMKSHKATPEQKQNFVPPSTMRDRTVFKPLHLDQTGNILSDFKHPPYMLPKLGKERHRYNHITGAEAKGKPHSYEGGLTREERATYQSDLHMPNYASVMDIKDYRVKIPSDEQPEAGKFYQSQQIYKEDMHRHTRYRLPPRERYNKPMSSYMNHGWKDPVSDFGAKHGRGSTFITAFADSMILGPRHP